MFVCVRVCCVCVLCMYKQTHILTLLSPSLSLSIYIHIFFSFSFFRHKADRAGNDNGRRMLPDPYDGPTIPLSQQHRYVCVRGEMNKFGVVLQFR